MASTKDTFEADTFSANTFAAGVFRGTGVEDPSIDIPGKVSLRARVQDNVTLGASPLNNVHLSHGLN